MLVNLRSHVEKHVCHRDINDRLHFSTFNYWFTSKRRQRASQSEEKQLGIFLQSWYPDWGIVQRMSDVALSDHQTYRLRGTCSTQFEITRFHNENQLGMGEAKRNCCKVQLWQIVLSSKILPFCDFDTRGAWVNCSRYACHEQTEEYWGHNAGQGYHWAAKK